VGVLNAHAGHTQSLIPHAADSCEHENYVHNLIYLQAEKFVIMIRHAA